MYSEKINELKKISEERLVSLASELPASKDGVNASFEVRQELRSKGGELLDTDVGECTYFGELVFTADGKEMAFSFSVAVNGGEYAKDELDAALSATEADIKRFFLELEGSSHGEYFSMLSIEREAELIPKEEEKSPFDYKRFIIYTSLAAAAIALVAILVGKIIPTLLS